MRTKEEFPYNNWYIEIDEENYQIVNDWKKRQKYNNDLSEYDYQVRFVNYLGRGGERGRWWVGRGPSQGITTNEFIKYVLLKDIEKPIDNDINYLVEFLSKLNIK